MNFRFTVLETVLNRAEFRWKWIRFLQCTFLIATGLLLLLLGLGSAVLTGWIVDRALANTLLGAMVAIAFLAEIVMIISVAAGSPERRRLADAVEQTDRRFLDRLHALLFLEPRRMDRTAHSFAVRIASQAQTVVTQAPARDPYTLRRCAIQFSALLVLLVLTSGLFQKYSPWDRLQVIKAATAQPAPAAPKSLELGPINTNNAEHELPWGEVRITDPGTDVRVTKVDVVPLQIEAAANHALKSVAWYSAVNGGKEKTHDLPPPQEPRYAHYQPAVYLDEWNLADWDVLTYYAKAITEQQTNYASEIYFIEVRPFREDILKMPGGEGGKAYQCINELTALINRQQHVIRETHRFAQRPPVREELRVQDRDKLSEAEKELGGSTRHLYARMASEMENQPIGEALDNLARAEKSLVTAGNQLREEKLEEGQKTERSALSELVAARKIFQKAVSDNPKAFEQENADEPPPVADASRKLKEMAEFRDEAKAAQDFVRQKLEEQRKLEQEMRGAPRQTLQRLGKQERDLKNSMEQFQQNHPQPFKGLDEQRAAASESLAKAADAMEKRTGDPQRAAQSATESLQQLSDAVKHRSTEQQLADAYKLKQMLDQQIKTFDERSRPDSKVSDESLQKAVENSRQAVNELRRTAEQEPTREAFGDQLREALSGDKKVQLDAKLNRLERPRTLEQAQDGTKEQRAAEARDALGEVSQAFDESQPQSLRMARKSDSLKPGDQDSFAQGMAELDSLLKALQSQRQITPEDAAKQAREALMNLQSGMRSQYGNNQSGNQILAQLDQMIKERGLDPGNLERLRAALHQFSMELTSKNSAEKEKPDMANIDPSRLPPAYRGRIQKYFQKLSEQ